MSNSESTKRATLESGRRKLEEFRRKKEAALAGRKASVPSQSTMQENKASIEAYEREESLKSQIAELLGSVDELHRSLQDERYNSSILEDTVTELRKELSEAKSAGQEELVADLQQAKASLEAERETLLSDLQASQNKLEKVSSMKERMAEMENEIDVARQSQQSDKEAMSNLLAKNEELESYHDALLVKLKESDTNFQHEVEKLKEENASLKMAVEDGQIHAGHLQELEATLAESSDRLSQLQSENDALRSQIEEFSTVQQSYEKAQFELDNALEVVSTRQNEIDELHAQLKEIADADEQEKLNKGLMKELQDQCEELIAELENKTALLSSKEDEMEKIVQNAQSATESSELEKEELANQLDQVNEEKLLIMQKVSELQDKLRGDASLQEELVEKDDTINRLQKDLDEIMSQLERVLEEKEVLSGQNKEILELTELAQSKAEKLEADLVDAGNVAEEAITQREDISQKFQGLRSQYEELVAQKDSLLAENGNLREQIESLDTSNASTEQIEQLDEALEKEKTHRQQLEVEVERLRGLEVTFNSQVEEYETKCGSAESRSVELQHLVETLKAEEARLQSKCTEMEQQVAELKLQIERKEDNAVHDEEAKKLKMANSLLQTELQTAQSEVSLAKSRLSELELAKQNASKAPDRFEQQIASIREELEVTREQLSTEKRRTSQLEDFLARQKKDSESAGSGSGNKKEDDAADMEAAALAGGSAFKPIVGLIRSLPSPLGSNSLLTSAALQLDKAVVALDARPQYRALVIVYFVLLHLLVLV